MKALRYILKWLHGLLSMDASLSAGIDSHKRESKNKEAIDAFERAIHINPDDAEAYYTLAVTYESIGRSEEAIAAYKEAIRIKPDFPPAQFLLGNSYVIDGNKESALQIHKVLCKLDVDLADTLLESIHNCTLTNANVRKSLCSGHSNDLNRLLTYSGKTKGVRVEWHFHKPQDPIMMQKNRPPSRRDCCYSNRINKEVCHGQLYQRTAE